MNIPRIAQLQAVSLREGDEIMIGREWYFVETVLTLPGMKVSPTLRKVDTEDYFYPILNAHEILTVMLP